MVNIKINLIISLYLKKESQQVKVDFIKQRIVNQN